MGRKEPTMSDRTLGIYARVSTDDQNIDHQRENLLDYADDLGYDGVTVYADTSTGTDTARADYQQLLTAVEEGEVDAVACRSVTRLGRSMRQINQHVHKIVDDHGCGLYIRNDNVEIEPGDGLSMSDKILLDVLGWAGEVEAKKLQENIQAGLEAARAEGKWVGRPPFGFDVDDGGYLQPNENYQKAQEVIHAMDELGWSQRKTARYTGVARSTLRGIMDRKEMYENPAE